MSIVVLMETEPLEAPSGGGNWAPGGIRALHAARTDPPVPEDPVPEDPPERTLCGMDARAMERHGYQPEQPSATWYPRNLEGWVCARCDAALRNS